MDVKTRKFRSTDHLYKAGSLSLGGEVTGRRLCPAVPRVRRLLTGVPTLRNRSSNFWEVQYWIEPTIFTNTKPNMKIVQEEIFGPVGVLIKFEDEEDVLRQANDTMYGLAAAVFSNDVSRALGVAHKLRAGTVWVNHVNQVHAQIPFGGYKQSGIGRDLGEYAINHYTAVKAVHINVGNVRI